MRNPVEPDFGADTQGACVVGGWVRWRWTLLVAALLLLIVSAGILNPVVWRALGVYPLKPGFADVEAIMAASDAARAGVDPYTSPNLFDSYERAHVYGPAWLAIGSTGFGVAHIAEFGVLTLVLFMASLACWYQPLSFRAAGVAFLIMLSAPVILGMERANNDLLMIVLLTVAALASAKPGLCREAGVPFILASAAWLKLYPVFAGAALLAMPGSLGVSIRRCALWLGIMIFGVVMYAGDFARVLINVPKPETVFALDLGYSLKLFFEGQGLLRFSMWSGGGAALLIALVALWRCRRDYWHLIPLTGARAFLAVSAGVIWLGSLLMVSSFLYRAVWLLPLMAGCCLQRDRAKAGRSVCLWMILAMWFWWFQWQANYLWMVGQKPSGLYVFSSMIGLTHAGVLLTTTLIAWMMTGWMWRHVQVYQNQSE
jgi:hypothetical protein